MSETDQKLSEQKTITDRNDSATTEHSRGSGLKILIILLLLMVIGGLIAGGYFAWQQWQTYQLYKQQTLEELQRQINDRVQLKDMEKLRAENQKHQQTLQQLNTQIAENKKELVALRGASEKLFELYGRDKNGWQLAEVEYLLRIAQHRLVIENDFQGAAKTLRAADEKLAEIADPGFLPVRKSIATEIAELQSRVRPDLTGMVLTLTSLVHQIPQLKIKIQSASEAQKKMPTDSNNAVDWSQVTLDNWQSEMTQWAKGLISVKRQKSTQTFDQTTSINIHETLDENLKLAKWAVLERNQAQFESLMGQNIDLFQQYFDLDDPYHQEILQSMSALSKQTVQPELPDITKSLIQLKKIIAYQESIGKAVLEETVQENNND